DDVIIFDTKDGKPVARPIIGLTFAAFHPFDVRAGGNQDEVQVNVNAPVSVDGLIGFDKLVTLGTEFADDFVISNKSVTGAGLNVRYANVDSDEADGLEDDDEFFVQYTAPGVAYRAMGGLGSDTIDLTGDVTEDVVTRELEGTSGAVNHLISSSDTAYNRTPVDGLPLNVTDPGSVIITETNGFTAVREGGDIALTGKNLTALDKYYVSLAMQPRGTVYVTVSAARSPQEENDDVLKNS